MNAAEYEQHIKERLASTPLGSLRMSMYGREGVDETDRQIARGLRAWAIQRPGYNGRIKRAIVFGRNRSDALRRASAPARLGEEVNDQVTDARPITSGWEQPVEWPFS